MGASSSSSPSRPALEQRAGRVVAPHARAEEAEAHRLADDERRARSAASPLVPSSMPNGATHSAARAARRRAPPAPRPRCPRSTRAPCRRGCARRGPCARQPVGRRAARDGEIESAPSRTRRRRGAVLGEPRRRACATTRSRSARALHDAAVEENAVGCRATCAALPLGRSGSAARLTCAEERREVPRDRGIRRVRQAELRERRARARRRARASFGTSGKKPSTSVCSTSSRVSSVRSGPAEELGAAARRSAMGTDRHGLVAEEPLLRGAARVRERRDLPAIERLAPRPRAGLHDVREREVHVVAAEQDVIADRDAREREAPALLGRGDGREVRRAAADVDDEDHVARLELLAPAGRRARAIHA